MSTARAVTNASRCHRDGCALRLPARRRDRRAQRDDAHGHHDDPIGRNPADFPLSYRGRKRRCLYDRNRRRSAWALERKKRPIETWSEYPHLSVWVDATSSGIQFHVLQHSPTLYGPWRVKKFEHRGRPLSDHIVSTNPDEIREAYDAISKTAYEAEGLLYSNSRQAHENRALVLRDYRR